MASQQGEPTEPTEIAEAIDFDGTNDYLSRNSDLAGNVDSKTFTFSCWVYGSTLQDRIYQAANDLTNQVLIYRASTGKLKLQGTTSVGTIVLNIDSTTIIPLNTWSNIIISIDMDTQANCKLYINDKVDTIVFNTFIVGSTPKFTQGAHFLGTQNNFTTYLKGRLSNLFLDYTYRNLSIEANRRLFITADRKPALNQQALNPILYLPLNDPTQPGLNLGTGGDFSLVGTVARSGRGPNQYNATMCDLASESSQALIRGLTINSTDFTLAFNLRHRTTGENQSIVAVYVNSNDTINVRRGSASGNLVMRYYKSGSGGTVWTKTLPGTSVVDRNYQITISNSATSFHVSVNGVVTTSAGISNAFAIAGGFFKICGDHNVSTVSAVVGNVFFHTTHIDLSVPDNLAKFVTGTGIDAKPVDLGVNGELPFGVAPLIYLPMYANNVGKNYGTGGDFTVNSGPFEGARGANEFWGNKADFDGSTGYLNRTANLTGVASGKLFSASFYIAPDIDLISQFIIDCKTNVDGWRFYINKTPIGQIQIQGRNSSGTTVLEAYTTTTAITPSAPGYVQMCVDLANTANRFIYINGVAQSVTWTTFSNLAIDFSGVQKLRLGANAQTTPASYLEGKLSEFYFTTDYIDFSQEANRLKFRDAFGNPVDLTPQIEAGDIPNPAIYMRFDPANFGKNSGTGGDFIANGTILDGGQL